MIDPNDLRLDLDRLEAIEKATLRFVVQALLDFQEEAAAIFRNESDQPADIAEDITREALDRLGMPRIKIRLFGKVDYKVARYCFHPEFAVRQALFVDSKAENVQGQTSATIQIGQTSLEVRQVRSGTPVRVPGGLPPIYRQNNEEYLTTTVIVKFNYTETNNQKELVSITLAALPNGLLQERYNPTEQDDIWLAGRDAPTLGENFRVRVSFRKLQQKARWRVQTIHVGTPQPFVWVE